MDRVVVVGASAAGLSAAEALRRLGHTGTITVVGDEDHLPYDRPPLSKQLLRGEWQRERLDLRRSADLGALDLDLRLGVPAAGVDTATRTVGLADGGEVPYEALVVATGVRPRRLPGGEGLTGVHVLRTLQDALGLRAVLAAGRRLVVVGAGFIGAEAASTARALGAEVTLVEPAPVPMAAAVGEAVGSMLTELHRAHDVDVRTGIGVEALLAADGAVTGVRLTDGSTLAADDVLVAIGSVPNTEWLAGSGLTVDDGLVCDEHCTAGDGVYGVGDVARWHNPLFGVSMRIEHRTNAAEQAVAAARNLLQPQGRRPYAPVPYFWSDQYDLRLQAHGYLRGHDDAVVVDGDTATRRALVAYRKGDRLVGVAAVGMPPTVLRAWRSRLLQAVPWSSVVEGAAAS